MSTNKPGVKIVMSERVATNLIQYGIGALVTFATLVAAYFGVRP